MLSLGNSAAVISTSYSSKWSQSCWSAKWPWSCCTLFQNRAMAWDDANLPLDKQRQQHQLHDATLQHNLFQSPTPTNHCPECGFVSRGVNPERNLLDHLKTHTGEKPFNCPHCPYKSLKRGNLNRHIFNQHGKFPMRMWKIFHENTSCLYFCNKLFITIFSNRLLVSYLKIFQSLFFYLRKRNMLLKG